MARRADFAGMTRPEWLVVQKEELARLDGIRQTAPRQEVPLCEIRRSAARLDRDPDSVRRMLRRSYGTTAPAAYRFDEWLLPLLYAHGQLAGLHEDLVETRAELVAGGDQVPAELAVVPDCYTTFTRAFARRYPRRVREFHRLGGTAHRARHVYLLWSAEERNEIWQLDVCRLDIWIRPTGWTTALRPWLIAVIDDKTRMVMGAMLCLQQPTADEVAACLVRAMRPKSTPVPGVTYGGVPGQILCDNGPENRGEVLTMLLARVGQLRTGAVLRHVARYTPTMKGKIERWFGYFQLRAVWNLPGYSKGPRSYTDRDVFAGTVADLLDEQQLWARLNERIEWHNFTRPHRSLGKRTPLEVWAADTTPLVTAPLSQFRFALLKAKKPRRAHRYGIEFAGQVYVSLGAAYDNVVGDLVLVGALPHDPSFVEVFDTDGHWICTAHPTTAFDAADAADAGIRRHDHYREEIGALEAAHSLHVARKEALDAAGHAPSLTATALSTRTTPVSAQRASTGTPARTGPVIPDEDWLAASRRAVIAGLPAPDLADDAVAAEPSAEGTSDAPRPNAGPIGPDGGRS